MCMYITRSPGQELSSGRIGAHDAIVLLLITTWTSSENRVVQPKSVVKTLGLLFNIIILASFPSSACIFQFTLCWNELS